MLQICTFVTWKQYFFLSNQNRVFFTKCIINATRLCQLWSHVKNLKLITRRDHLFFPVGCLPCYLLLYIDRSVTWFYVLTMSGLCQEFRELITSLLHLNKSHHHHHAFSFFFSADHHLFLAVRTDSGENITMGANLSISKSLMLRLRFKWDVLRNRDYFLFSNTMSPFAWLSACRSSTSLKILSQMSQPGYLCLLAMITNWLRF